MLQFEYAQSWLDAGATLKAALSLLNNNGYSYYLIKKDGLYSFNYDFYSEYFAYSNFFAVSQEWKHLIKDLIIGRI